MMNAHYQALLDLMPEALKKKTEKELLGALDDPKKRMSIMKEVNKRRSYKVSREEIPWFPVVDSILCTGCGICSDFCPKSVYDLVEDVENPVKDVENPAKDVRNPAKKIQKAQVVKPYQCVMLCTGCLTKCPQNAITFPNKDDFYKYIEYK